MIASSSRTSISSRSGTAKSARKVEKSQENTTQKQTPSQRIYTYKNMKLDAAGDTKLNGVQNKAKADDDSSSDCDSSNGAHVKDARVKHEQQGKPTTSSAKQSNVVTPRTAKQQKKAFDVLHALKSGGNLGWVRAIVIFGILK